MAEYLSQKEIEFILDFIPVNRNYDDDNAKLLYDKHYSGFEVQLKSKPLYKQQIPKLKEKLKNIYFKSFSQPGKYVGALASSSIGEKIVQSGLSSFHKAGQNKIELTVGVPKFEELLSATRNSKTPSMDIHLHGNLSLKDTILFARSKLEYTTVGTFLLNYEISNEPRNDSWYKFREKYTCGTEYKECEWHIRLFLCKKQRYKYQKSLEDISGSIFFSFEDLFPVCSFEEQNIIDVYFKTNTIEDVGYITNENKGYYIARDLLIPSLQFIPTGGIEGVSKCFFYEKDKKWVISTLGSCLKKVALIPEVDFKNTRSNDLWETYEMFGVEATWEFLMQDFSKLLTTIKRHTSLLASRMLYLGKPQAVSRTGIDVKSVGVFAKVAFECPLTNLLDAAFTSEKDDISGVAAAITVGKLSKTGTGSIEIIEVEPTLNDFRI